MCGITVSIALGRSGPSQTPGHANGHASPGQRNHNPPKPTSLEDELNKSLDLIAHRGPDAKGVWVSPDGRIGNAPPPPPFFLPPSHL